MALAPQAERLAQDHRGLQVALRAAVVREVVRLWPALDPMNLRRTWPALQAALEALVFMHRATSAGLAARYLRETRALEGLPSLPALRLMRDMDRTALRTSLMVTGPISIRQDVTRGVPAAEAGKKALIRSSGAVSRHVLDGGRETIIETIEADPDAQGWTRVTASEPCYFCALLASRGGVYTKASGGFQAHDHCSCTVAPVYQRDEAMTARAEEFDRLYTEATAGEKNKLLAFRRAYEGRA